MSTIFLDRLEWADLAEKEAVAMAASILLDGETEPLRPIRISGRATPLAFYDSVNLVRLDFFLPAVGTRTHLFLLDSATHFHVLDGSSPPLHRANAIEGVRIGDDTAADYLRFFCFVVRGDEGPFLLFEEATGSADPDESGKAAEARAIAQPLEERGQDDQGRYLFAAVVKYGSNLFRAEFAVAPDGMTEMLDDEPLLEDVPEGPFPELADLHRREVVLSLIQQSIMPRPENKDILRILVELLLERSLASKEDSTLLAHFNARLTSGSPLEQFARIVASSAPIVAIESTLPFVEEAVAGIVKERIPSGVPLNVVPSSLASDETRVAVRVPDRGPAVVLVPQHAYSGIAESERVAYQIASRDVACLIGCERVDDLPPALREVVDLTLHFPRLTPELFEAFFRRVTGGDPPKEWAGEDAHWVTHVLHSDFQHPLGLELSPEDAVAYIRERATERLRDVDPVKGLGLAELHGLGEARVFAEDLIADIHQAIAGELEWSQVDRGVLLVGAPGTGKTTLARAIAKDCGIRFVNASATSWQANNHLGEHIRAMRADFTRARRFSPSILFIDEIDSVGNRERFEGRNTQYMTEVVNALLEQIQGMDPKAPVIVIGATNYGDRIDPALKRAGRLDRTIHIPKPNTGALSKIYEHYLLQYLEDRIGPDVDVDALGRLSLGATGADVELFVRGAARRARKAGRDVSQADLVAELTRKPRDSDTSPRLSEEEIHRIAVHEAGHALASYLTSSQGRAIGFVSIVPRTDGTLGFVANLADERVFQTRKELLERLEVLLAGRAAEEIVFGEDEVSAGAGGSDGSSDLAVATRGALQIISQYGLGPERSLLSTRSPDGEQLKEAEELLERCYKSVLSKLWKHADTLERLTGALVERQELTGDEVRSLLA